MQPALDETQRDNDGVTVADRSSSVSRYTLLDLYRSINAPMESFFGSLKAELVHEQHYPTREAAKRDLFAYIEGYYNRQRLHSALGYITPEQAELRTA